MHETATTLAPDRAAHALWQAERHRQVSAPTGNLALIAYQGVGAAATIETLPLVARHRAGEAGLWVTPTAEGVTVDAEPLRAETFVPRLRADGTPLIRWQQRAADVFSLDGSDCELRVYDAAAPNLVRFAGIDSWPFDPAWVVRAHFERFAADSATPWDFSREADRGHTKKVPGRLHFALGSETLAWTGFLDGTQLVLVFADGGTGRGSYAPGRFLRLPCPDRDGPVALDFNRAFIPPCGFSDYYSCPLPPRENRTGVVVRAGEQRVRWRDEPRR